FHDVSSGLNWDTFYSYDGSGRVVLTAAPSAVSGYDDSYPDLLESQSGHYQYLRDNQGLVTVFDYYIGTTATETAVGSAKGYQQDVQIQMGELGQLSGLN